MKSKVSPSIILIVTERKILFRILFTVKSLLESTGDTYGKEAIFYAVGDILPLKLQIVTFLIEDWETLIFIFFPAIFPILVLAMSSSSPYQSRLLSFLNRQSLRLRHRLGKTARSLQVAAEWGVQILIYPIYLLVQTGRFAGQSLGKKVESAQLPSSNPDETAVPPPIPVDQPIERVLALVDPWLAETPSQPPTVEQLSEKIQHKVQLALKQRETPPSPISVLNQVTNQLKTTLNSQKSSQLALQGVASSLEDHQLILIGTDNQPQKRLSEEQQITLEKQIKAELANYYYEKRLYHLVGRHFPSLIPQFTEKDENIAPPVRWFWRTMRWVQTSDVAIALNLFGESSLVDVDPPPKILVNHPQYPLGEWDNPPPPSLETPIPNNDIFQLSQLIQAAVDYFYGGLQKSGLTQSPLVKNLPEASLIVQQKLQETAEISQEKLLKPAVGQLQKLKEQIYHKTEETDPFQLQAIIEAAIAHFFPPTPTVQSSSPISLKAAEPEDPWLTAADLFPVVIDLKSSEESRPSLPKGQPLPLLSQPLKPIPLEALSSITELGKPINPFEASCGEENSLLSHDMAVTMETVMPPPVSLTSPQSEPQGVEFIPDWIETDSKAVGYVKHPLEQLLQALDRSLLWIEDILVKTWQTLRTFFFSS